MFGKDTPPGALKLVDHQVLPSGIVIAIYVEPSAREIARQEWIKREE